MFAASLDDEQQGTVTVTHGTQTVSLRAAGLTLPYPSGLERGRARFPDAELFVVARAPRGLQRAAVEQGVNYLDLSGRGRIVVPGLVYVVEPRAEVSAFARNTSSSPFAPKASRVVRALLSEPSARWRVSHLAALAHSNPGNVHRTLSALVEQGFVERDEDAYLLADAGSLLDAWREQCQPPRERIVVPVDGMLRDDVERWLGRLDGRAVVSGELAAELLAPYLPAESAILHAISPDAFADIVSKWARDPLLPPASPRAAGLVIDLADEGVTDFRSNRAGLPLASAQQVYVDLAGDLGRGREAAEHLRRTALGY